MFNIDSIINAAIKSIGLEPDKARAQLVALQNWVVESMKNLDSRMRAMESDRSDMHAKLDRILLILEKQADEHSILEKVENGQPIDRSATILAIADGRGDSECVNHDGRSGTNG